MMSSLHLNVPVEFHDGPAIPVAFDGGNVKLFRPLSHSYETHHVTELPMLLVAPPRFESSLKELVELGDGLDEATTEMAGHIKEMIDGTPRNLGSTTRPEYDPAKTSLNSRVASKVSELELLGIPHSFGSLMTKKAAFLKHGPAGLVDGRSKRRSDAFGNTDRRLIDAMTKVMARHTNETTGNVSTLYVEVRKQLMKDYPGEDIKVPTESTFRRRVKELDAGHQVFAKATTRRSAGTRPKQSKRILKSREAHLPGAEVQIDSTPFDAFYRDEKGATKRANLTIMVDKATRSIIGSMFVPDGTKGVDLAFLLARCLVPRQLRPGEASIRDRDLPELPWVQMLDRDARDRFDTAQPFIIPQRIMVDNGADYISPVFESACQQFGISLTRARVRTGTDKAVAEGTFRIIREGFTAFLPGYLGGNIGDRGAGIEKRAGILDLFALTELFERWVTVVYQNTPQEGLRDPWHASVKHTPNSMYGALFPVTGAVPVPLSGDDYIALLPREERTIDSMGVRFDNRRYDAPGLFLLRDLRDADTGKFRKWNVHYDPYDPSAVWVDDPDTKMWIECPWVSPNDARRRPFADTIYEEALALRLEYGALGGEFHRADVTAALVKAAKDARLKEERAESRRVAAAARRPVPELAPTRVVVSQDDIDDDDVDEFESLPDFDPSKEIF